MNYGNISAGAGGNKYDSNNRNAIHAAGVVAYMVGREDLRSCVIDCANYGSVNSKGGRTGNICGSAVSTTTGGVAPTDWAKALDAPASDGNLVGTVLDSSGKPWEGIMVTDGRQYVKTDANGRFAMTSDLNASNFVYLSVPADASFQVRNGIPQTYKVILTCSHHNPFKTPNTSPHGSHNAYSLNYKEYLSFFSQYKAVYAWNGHNHVNFYYDYKGKTTPHGAPNIQCISVARCTGALRLNREIAAQGEPQGYMVMEVRGDSLSWYYKGVGTGKETQMRAYTPEKTSDATVKVNVWRGKGY